ncbi:MAG: hypothetical protein BWY17_01611 [Deltaproteobacteria bacterium ADurb.Bin207]|nr:MAG: hypothetical protein BWY17_01611 [Deltaproteobacteria bacterium ADurb.Bin207]
MCCLGPGLREVWMRIGLGNQVIDESPWLLRQVAGKEFATGRVPGLRPFEVIPSGAIGLSIAALSDSDQTEEGECQESSFRGLGLDDGARTPPVIVVRLAFFQARS